MIHDLCNTVFTEDLYKGHPKSFCMSSTYCTTIFSTIYRPTSVKRAFFTDSCESAADKTSF